LGPVEEQQPKTSLGFRVLLAGLIFFMAFLVGLVLLVDQRSAVVLVAVVALAMRLPLLLARVRLGREITGATLSQQQRPGVVELELSEETGFPTLVVLGVLEQQIVSPALR
jgi:hypothetical protein